MMFLLDLRRCLCTKRITLPSFPFIQCSAVKTLCFFKKIHCRCQSETASALGTKPLSTPAMMVNPKPDPPVVTILDSNPGLVV
jgi:hypothetical protein